MLRFVKTILATVLLLDIYFMIGLAVRTRNMSELTDAWLVVNLVCALLVLYTLEAIGKSRKSRQQKSVTPTRVDPPRSTVRLIERKDL